MRRFSFFLIFVVVLLSSCAQHQNNIPLTKKTNFESKFQENEKNNDNSLDSQLLNLTDQIIANLSQECKSKIAIIEFSDLNGNITEFGMYLSEELITRLYLTKKFEVIERQLLNQVIAEQKLGMTGLIDDESAIAIGKLLGVDAIVTGTVTDLGVSLKVNARLIATETGTVFAVAATEFSKDEKVKILLSRMKENEKTFHKKDENEKKLEKQKPVDNKIFFKEDFSSIQDGDVPEGWLGTDHLMVKSRGKQKFLTHFEEGETKLIINGIDLPKNFKIEWTFFTQSVGGLAKAGTDLTLGNLKAGVHNKSYGHSKCYINNTRKETDFDVIKKTIKVTLEKRGSLFRLFVDGAEQIFIRYTNFKPATSLCLDFGKYNFNLYEIVGTELDNNN